MANDLDRGELSRRKIGGRPGATFCVLAKRAFGVRLGRRSEHALEYQNVAPDTLSIDDQFHFWTVRQDIAV